LVDLFEMYIGLHVKYPLFLLDFNENPLSGSRFVPRGRTDRHDAANSRFSQFFERA